jgi:hypothetical protein
MNETINGVRRKLQTLWSRSKGLSTLLVTSLALFLVASPAVAADGWAGGLTVADVRTSDYTVETYFGTTSQPRDTCSYFGYYFRFDATTVQGKNMYATLLAAKLSGKPVAVWYHNSSAPGTTETTDCTDVALAAVYGITIQ